MCIRLSDTPAADSATRLSDDVMLDRLQHAAFGYFLKTSNPQNGLVADTTRDGSPSSIAVGPAAQP